MKAEQLGRKLRDRLERTLSVRLEGVGDVAVLLSAGVDSTSVLFALLAIGKNVKAYSCGWESFDSRDVKLARHNASVMGVPFSKVTLPESLEELWLWARKIVLELDARTKTEVECTFPVVHAIRQIEEPAICTGNAADGYFLLSRVARDYVATSQLGDRFREQYFDKPNVCQIQQIGKYATKFGKLMVHPYINRSLLDVFEGASWETLNKPRQKEVVRQTYPFLFDRVEVRNHSNFQLGDGKIAKRFERLLSSKYNKTNRKRVADLYRDIAKGLL